MPCPSASAGDRALFLELLAKADDPALSIRTCREKRARPAHTPSCSGRSAPALKADKQIVLAAVAKEAGDICCYRAR